MKKNYYLFLMVTFLIINVPIFSQDKPIMGYDKVSWGVSINEVKRVFNIGNNFTFNENVGNDSNIARLIQLNISNDIIQRTFVFNKWNSNDYRLYSVWVRYNISNVSSRNLESALIKNFGNITSRNEELRECNHPNAGDGWIT